MVTSVYDRAPLSSSPALPLPTYYGRAAIKKSHYKWLIATYFFVGGTAGAAQLIASSADLIAPGRLRPMVRAGRYLALGGSLLCPLLLIKDLHTPSRWYNMLRIFRPTSPMSIGSWTLAAFGLFSWWAAAGQALEDATRLGAGRGLSRLFGMPAAVAGALMSVYTGSLLSATSVPLWSAAPLHLAALFGTSAASTAAAAIALSLQVMGAPRRLLLNLDRFSFMVGCAELFLSMAVRHRWARSRVASPLRRQPIGFADSFGALGLGVIVPLSVHSAQLLSGRRWPAAATLAAISSLLGGYVLRAVLIFAGNESADIPEDYFGLRG